MRTFTYATEENIYGPACPIASASNKSSDESARLARAFVCSYKSKHVSNEDSSKNSDLDTAVLGVASQGGGGGGTLIFLHT